MKAPDQARGNLDMLLLAVLTDDGLAVLERAAPFHVTGVRRHFIDLFSATEIRALGTAFAKVRAALAAHSASAS